MKSLLIKEFYNIKDAMKTNILIMLVLSVASVLKNGSAAIMPIMIIGMSTLISQSMRAEKEKGWNRYELTMPISRKDVVVSKYLLFLLLCGGGMLIGFFVNIVSMIMRGNISWLNMIIYIMISFVVALLAGSFLIPLTYKLGTDQSETLSLICYAVPVGVLIAILLLMKNKIQNLYAIHNLLFWMGGILGVTIVLFLLSAFISYRIYKAKQF